MFVTYLLRELRRRMRQAIFAALGLAVGIGLVITVTAASAGVRDAQASVLHSLYGVGTDITVTKTPSANSSPGFGVRVGPGGSGQRPKAGTKFSQDALLPGALGTLSDSSVSSISQLNNVAAAAGALSLTDLSVSGRIPSQPAVAPGGSTSGSSSQSSNIHTSSFSVNGADLSASGVGPLSSAKLTAGRTFTTADADANRAVVDADYAASAKLKVGSQITVAGKKFTVIGLVRQSKGASPADVYIPLARAQSLAGMKDKVNTIYVAAASASDISTVSKEISSLLPNATVTTSSDLANEVSGSLSSAASLANNLGRWLAVAVLAAAFLLASLLMMAAVSHRVREFGTLKALGWPTRRVTGQVMGEAIVIGLMGGIAGVALGFGGAKLVSAVAPPLKASTGLTSGSASPGGAVNPGGGPSGGGGPVGQRLAANAAHTVSVHLTAPVTLSAVALAVILAIAGGLIAGSFGGWRAARLRPAAALARVQ
jgi:ABC-type antimicrobial peptide transport system permease subunit